MITQEEYDAILAMKPEERVNQSSDIISDKIVGTLILFAKMYDMRNQHIDIATTKDAERELLQLLDESTKWIKEKAKTLFTIHCSARHNHNCHDYSTGHLHCDECGLMEKFVQELNEE